MNVKDAIAWSPGAIYDDDINSNNEDFSGASRIYQNIPTNKFPYLAYNIFFCVHNKKSNPMDMENDFSSDERETSIKSDTINTIVLNN